MRDGNIEQGKDVGGVCGRGAAPCRELGKQGAEGVVSGRDERLEDERGRGGTGGIVHDLDVWPQEADGTESPLTARRGLHMDERVAGRGGGRSGNSGGGGGECVGDC